MSKTYSTALASMSRGILRWAEARGIATRDIVTADELARLEIAGDDGRVPRRLHDDIWRRVERILSDSSFGLRSADSILNASSFGVVALVGMTSGTVGESLARSARYSRLLKDDVAAHVRETDRATVVSIHAREPLGRPVADASIAAFHHFLERWTGVRVKVEAVYFRHARPSDTSPYERFDCPVYFDHPTDAIAFDRGVRELPLVTARPEVARYLESLAEARLAEITGREGTRERVRAAVEDALVAEMRRGSTDIRHVARRLGTSPRSLQRALAAEGVSFRRIVDEVRLSIATPLVTLTDRPLERIAEELGYSDGKAFRRAFRRWAGAAPIELRRTRRC